MSLAQTAASALIREGVHYRLLAHPRTFSTRETAGAAHVPPDHIAKGVILEGEGRLVMVVVPGSHWVRLHAVEQELSRTLAFAAEDTVSALFPDCQPGAVPALGPAYGLEALMDEALATLAHVYFEAGDHEHLVEVSGEDFRRLLGGCRHGRYSRGD
jgi:Ala-tRNA(Pro) deacylase